MVQLIVTRPWRLEPIGRRHLNAAVKSWRPQVCYYPSVPSRAATILVGQLLWLQAGSQPAYVCGLPQCGAGNLALYLALGSLWGRLSAASSDRPGNSQLARKPASMARVRLRYRNRVGRGCGGHGIARTSPSVRF